MAIRKYADLRKHNVEIIQLDNRDCTATAPERSEDNSDIADQQLPKHVYFLKDKLLTFANMLDANSKSFYQEQLEAHLQANHKHKRRRAGQCLLPPDNAYRTGSMLPSKDDFQESIKICKKFAYAKRSNEEDLTNHYMDDIFQRSEEPLLRKSEKATSRTGAWVVYKNTAWTEDFSCFQQCLDRPYIEKSKPDIFYAIRMIQSDEDQAIPRGHVHDTYYDTVKFTYLAAARQMLGIRSTVTSTLSTADCSTPQQIKRATENLTFHDHGCFPFAIVELKRYKAGPADEETCEVQAAAAAVRALSLTRSLFEGSLWRDEMGRDSSGGQKTYPLPCCVTFTCAGTDVKVWIAYEDRSRQPIGVTMRCIYSTNVLLVWGVLSLRSIVSNMIEWSLDTFRSDVTHALRGLQPRLEAYKRRTTTRTSTMDNPQQSTSAASPPSMSQPPLGSYFSASPPDVDSGEEEAEEARSAKHAERDSTASKIFRFGVTSTERIHVSRPVESTEDGVAATAATVAHELGTRTGDFTFSTGNAGHNPSALNVPICQSWQPDVTKPSDPGPTTKIWSTQRRSAGESTLHIASTPLLFSEAFIKTFGRVHMTDTKPVLPSIVSDMPETETHHGSRDASPESPSRVLDQGQLQLDRYIELWRNAAYHALSSTNGNEYHYHLRGHPSRSIDPAEQQSTLAWLDVCDFEAAALDLKDSHPLQISDQEDRMSDSDFDPDQYSADEDGEESCSGDDGKFPATTVRNHARRRVSQERDGSYQNERNTRNSLKSASSDDGDSCDESKPGQHMSGQSSGSSTPSITASELGWFAVPRKGRQNVYVVRLPKPDLYPIDKA